MAELPSGTVTFLFTDIEGSTALLKELGGEYAALLTAHRQLLRDAAAANGGHEMGTEGDAMFFWFPRARQAVKAAADAQRALAGHEWPHGKRVRVRMGLHTGEPDVVEAEIIGMGLHRAARISAAAHGGQVLLSHSTAGVVSDDKASGLPTLRLGEYRLKDVDEPEVLHQLVVDGVPGDFPTPRAEPVGEPPRRSRRRLWPALLIVLLLAAGGAAAAVVLTTRGGNGGSAGTRTRTRPTTHGRATTTARKTTTRRVDTTPQAEQAWIRPRFIPYRPKRKREMAAYANRHYGIDAWRLAHPKVIVEHYSVTASVTKTVAAFAGDRADAELGELPGDCAHFIVDRDGTVYQLVRTTIMCRHTVGLNYTALGIEHIGQSDQDILDNKKQLAASLRLTLWLMSRYRIPLQNVIGHNESLRSPYRRELVAAWRCQTHGDWTHADMVRYRRLLHHRGLAEGLRSLVPVRGIEGPAGATPGC